MDRAELAGKWAGALNQVVYVSRARDAIEHDLGQLIDVLVSVLLAEPFAANAAIDVGERLIESGFVKPACLSCSVDVLGAGLPDLPELAGSVPPQRLLAVLGALSAGFASGTRDVLFADQQDIRTALVRAMHNVERDLAASEARFRQVFTTAALGMIISSPNGTIVQANDAVLRMLGYQQDQLVGGKLTDIFHPDQSAQLLTRYAELLDSDKGPLRERCELVRADKDTAWVYLAVSVLRDGSGDRDVHVTMVEDVSDLHLLEHQLSYQGTHDALTGLPNRHAFMGKVEEAVGGGARTSVFHLNLDAFSVINHGLGWHAGDTLLRVVASRLTALFAGERAFVARFGSDEFGIVLQHGESTPDAVTIAQEINESLTEAVYVDGNGVAVSATVAVARDVPMGVDPDDLLRTTGITVRELKAAGRGQWGLIDPEVDAANRAHFALAASVPGAWESGELAVDYRPVVDLGTRDVVAAQALLHWQHPERGRLDHQACLRAIADTGFGPSIGQWLLRTAASDMTGTIPRTLYLELTAEQAVDPDLVAVVRSVLSDTGLAGAVLELGVPVKALDTRDRQAEDNIQVLDDLGVNFVLYGYGSASRDLGYLDSLPLRGVRLVRHVVEWVNRHAESHLPGVLATKGLVPLVRSAGLDMMVSGIETEKQAEWWCAVGVNRAAGPLFGEPGALPDLSGV